MEFCHILLGVFDYKVLLCAHIHLWSQTKKIIEIKLTTTRRNHIAWVQVNSIQVRLCTVDFYRPKTVLIPREMLYISISYAVVTPLRKAASYEPRIAILGIWGDTWLTRGKYGIYVAVRDSYGVYVTPSAT